MRLLHVVPTYLPAVLQAHFGDSVSHWRRTIDQGGVKLDGEPVTEVDVARESLGGGVLQVGKRRFGRLAENV